MGRLRTVPLTTAKKKKFVITTDQTGIEVNILIQGMILVF